MGVAIVRDCDNFDTLLHRAADLYEAKTADRNCLRVAPEPEEFAHVETVNTARR